MGAYDAFTITAKKIQNQLINTVTIINGDKEITVPALWDTGATASCISHSVVQKLSLQAIGKRIVLTPSGEKIMNTYCVDISIPRNVRFPGIVVNDSEIGKQGLGMLVGMDIITQGDLAVSNHNGKTVFTFRTPSQQTTDYVIQSNFAKALGPKHGKGKRKKK